MLAAREFGLRSPARATSAHTHLLLVGFVMMMICGVALWMFPRPAKDDARYRPQRAEWAYWLLTLGTSGRAALELLADSEAGPVVRSLIVAAGLAQVAGLLLFFWSMLPRIRSTLPPGDYGAAPPRGPRIPGPNPPRPRGRSESSFCRCSGRGRGPPRSASSPVPRRVPSAPSPRGRSAS